jgi:hypothetical protein
MQVVSACKATDGATFHHQSNKFLRQSAPWAIRFSGNTDSPLGHMNQGERRNGKIPGWSDRQRAAGSLSD